MKAATLIRTRIIGNRKITVEVFIEDNDTVDAIRRADEQIEKIINYELRSMPYTTIRLTGPVVIA